MSARTSVRRPAALAPARARARALVGGVLLGLAPARARARALVGGVLLGLALRSAACRPATELLVVVDSDLQVPAELGLVRAVIYDANRAVVSAQAFEVTAGASASGASSDRLPFSFAVVPEGGDANRRVTVEVQGWTAPGGDLRLSRRAVTGFIEHESLRLPMFLARRCVSPTPPCAAAETCTEGGCRAPDIAPSDLSPVASGAELGDGGG